MTPYEELMFTTLLIECVDEDELPSDFGTGFLLSGNEIEEGKSHMYLVTNRHVFEDVNNINLCITINDNGEPVIGQYARFGLTDLKNAVVFHPNDEIDLAVLEVTGLISCIMPNGLFVKVIPLESLERFNNDSISIADKVIFIGYPEDRGDHKNNLPLVRTGIIASHPMYDYNEKPIFVIDAQVFPGSSGSPVFVESVRNSYYEGKRLFEDKTIRLAGVISETMLKPNEIIIGDKKTTVPEVIGLGTVVKATELIKLIDSLEKETLVEKQTTL